MTNEINITKKEIREIFLKNGFKIKEGQTDLMPYVYDAAKELLEKSLEKIITAINSSKEKNLILDSIFIVKE